MCESNPRLDHETIGIKVLEDLYIHADYLDHPALGEPFSTLISLGRSIMTSEDLACSNVVKLNLHKQRLSFLQYLDFDDDPFPSLNGSWVVDPLKQSVTYRSYSSSLNPPILHRKELLVGKDHPKRSDWENTTKTAEDLGLFVNSSPIEIGRAHV